MAYTPAMPIDYFASLAPLYRSALSAIAALLFYGGWAFYVNAMHGTMVALKAACVQGTYSMLLTLGMAVLIEALYRFLLRFYRASATINWLTIVVSCSIIFSTSWWVNAMAGTPEIFNTVILGYIIGAVYTTAYVFSISRNGRVHASRSRKQ